jgi:hypothetical protein
VRPELACSSSPSLPQLPCQISPHTGGERSLASRKAGDHGQGCCVSLGGGTELGSLFLLRWYMLEG